jgi:sterol desaturase/sphingolipid hydroxylase (fatty acid hydroxylase superfamily)
MDSMIDYFANVPSWQRAVIIGAGFILFWILELMFGASQFAKYRHARTNLVFWASTLLTNLPLSGLTLATSLAVTEADLGILNLFEMPLWLNLLLAVAVLDLIAAYAHHRLVHFVPILWKLHVVHHSDPNVDSTTALRHNPLEAVMRAFFTLLGVGILGVAPGVLVTYQAIAILCAQWIHSDIHLPGPIDRVLSFVFVSPGMHRVHHHRALPWTDTNYSTVFSLWDRLFGTFAVRDSDEIEFGIDVIPDSEEREASALRLMLLPFRGDEEGYRLRSHAAGSGRGMNESGAVEMR